MTASSKYPIIFFWIILIVAAFFIFNKSIDEDFKGIPVTQQLTPPLSGLDKEYNVFRRAYNPETVVDMEAHPELERSLETYYDNRAYTGAPPTIPHPLLSEKGIGDKGCLQCHDNGGYVAQFEAYAPVTPHPELINCKQCHVPVKTTKLFKPHQWQAAKAQKVDNRAMPGSPPVIPHDLQMRSNCMACHSGPAAPKEIRVSHPERSNCRQCHVPVVSQAKAITEGYPTNMTWKRNNENE